MELYAIGFRSLVLFVVYIFFLFRVLYDYFYILVNFTEKKNLLLQNLCFVFISTYTEQKRNYYLSTYCAKKSKNSMDTRSERLLRSIEILWKWWMKKKNFKIDYENKAQPLNAFFFLFSAYGLGFSNEFFI